MKGKKLHLPVYLYMQSQAWGQNSHRDGAFSGFGEHEGFYDFDAHYPLCIYEDLDNTMLIALLGSHEGQE